MGYLLTIDWFLLCFANYSLAIVAMFSFFDQIIGWRH